MFLILFAAGLAAHGVGELNEIGWIPPVINHVYNLNPYLSDQSGLGQVFQLFLGYNSSPSLTQIGAYLAYFIVLLVSLILVPRFLLPHQEQTKA